MAFWSDPDFYRKQNYCLMTIIALTIIGMYIPLNNGSTLMDDPAILIMHSCQLMLAILGLIFHKKRNFSLQFDLFGSISPLLTIGMYFGLIEKEWNLDIMLPPSYFLLPPILCILLFISAWYFTKQDIKLLNRSERLWG